MSNPRFAIYIDGANIDTPARESHIRINYVRFLSYLVGVRQLVTANFYESWTANLGKRAFYSDVRKAGFKVILGPRVLVKVGQQEGKQKEIDVQIAVDAISDAYANHFDIALIGSGDGDMAPIVRKLKQMGKDVEVASFTGGNQLAWSLKQTATRIRDLTYDVRKIT